MKSVMTILSVISVLILAYEVIALRTGWFPTISEWFWSEESKHLSLPFAYMFFSGVLISHFFTGGTTPLTWPQIGVAFLFGAAGFVIMYFLGYSSGEGSIKKPD